MGLICPITACAAGAPPHFLVICTMSSFVSFYATHWEHYFTGVMEFGAFGPCEMHYLVILALFIIAAVGKPISKWTHLPWGISADVAVNVAFLSVFVVSLAMTFMSISNVLHNTKEEDDDDEDCDNAEKKRRKMRKGKKGESSSYVFNNDDNFKYKTAHSSALRGFIPCLVFVFLSCLWSLVELETLRSIPHVFILTFTFVFAYIAQRLLVQRVCGEPLVMLYPIFVPYFLCSVNGILGIVDSKTMAYLMLMVSIGQEILFGVKFIRQLSSYLHIRPFVVSKMRFDDDEDDEDDEEEEEEEEEEDEEDEN